MQVEENIKLAMGGLLEHKFRSILTMLGVIFGVMAVITMVSIGEGAKKEALAKYKDLGINNIIIREKDMDEEELETVRAKFSQGLSIEDANSIKKIIPNVEEVAPQIEKETEAKVEDKAASSTLIGITPAFQQIMNYDVDKGSFITNNHYDRHLKVCVIGSSIAKELFPMEDPIGKSIKVEDQWLEVAGVMTNKSLFTETVGELASRDMNNDIYIPLSTFNKRFSRDHVLQSEISQITVRAKSSENLMPMSAMIDNLIKRHHFNNDDYAIIIPFELLKQEEKERKIYNFLLGAIAAISLLVGGIGIMNIMLASVMERTREIGIRRALGAKKKEIMSQFLTEAVAISITGGIIGVILGVSLSLFVSLLTNVTTLITLYSILISFIVSVGVGISFGYLPARRAANLNPIESIRHE